MKDLMSKIQPHIDSLKKSFQGILSKFSKSGELDDDEELFDDEIVASDDDEKTVVHDLAAMKAELAAGGGDETETTVEPRADTASAIAASEDETVSTDTSDDTSTDVADGELTQQFDVEGTHGDFTAADLGLDDDEDDDEFESGLGSNRNSMIIRGVVILGIVWYALDEFVLKEQVPEGTQQQVTQQTKRPKRKKVRRKKKPEVQQQVAQATPTPTPEPTAEPNVPEQEPQLAQDNQMPAQMDPPPTQVEPQNQASNDPAVTNTEPQNQQMAKADPLQDNGIPVTDDSSNSDMAQTDGMDSGETPVQDLSLTDNMNSDSSNAKDDDEIAEDLGISPMAKMQLQKDLEAAQARIEALEQQNQQLILRNPASTQSMGEKEVENSVLTELQIKARAKKLSRESLAYIKVMVPDPVVDYDFVESPDFTLTNVPVGRGLVYNCSGGHWACVPKKLYYQCRDHAKWSLSKKKSPDCVVNSVYVNLKACKEAQSFKIGQLAEADFCKENNADSDREPASVEIDDSDVPYETGL